MNEDILKGQWHQIKGKVKEKWGKLTDDDLKKVDGKKDQLLGCLQEKYGWQKQKAEEELKSFEEACKECKTHSCDSMKKEGMHTNKHESEDKSDKRKVG